MSPAVSDPPWPADLEDAGSPGGRLPEEPAPADEEPARAHARRRLRAALETLRVAQSQVEDTVASGRDAGVTWEEMAAILGMTRQGVSKRYGRRRR